VSQAAARGGEAPGRVGRLGERLAAAHLERLGYALLERNVRIGHGEIDLIVSDEQALVFVEVKSRRVSSAAGPLGLEHEPLLALRARQRVRVRRLAAAWLRERRERPRAATIRFDAIGVVLDGEDRLLRLDHVEGAW